MRKRKYTRRHLLKSAALGAAGVAIHPILGRGSVARANPGTGDTFMVVINALGGSDGMNILCPTHLAPYAETAQNGGRRPTITLARRVSQGGGLPDSVDDGQGPYTPNLHSLNANNDHALHWRLGNIHQIWTENDLHLINKVSYPSPNQSHFTSQDIMSCGIRDLTSGDGRGWLGRLADEHGADDPLSVVSIGSTRKDFNADSNDPLIIANVANNSPDPLSPFQIDADNQYTTDHQLREAVMKDILGTDIPPAENPALTVFGTNQQAYELVERIQANTQGWAPAQGVSYPNTTLGNRLKAASQLLHGRDDFGTRVIYTSYGGHDTHSGQLNRQANLMRQLDEAVGAFAADLKNHSQGNLWDCCVIVVISEFGRRTFENGSAGTDHGHGNVFMVMGAPVKGLNDVGSGHTTPIVEADIQTNNTLPFAVDFRDIYSKVVQDHLSLSPANLFPDSNYTPDLQDVANIL